MCEKSCIHIEKVMWVTVSAMTNIINGTHTVKQNYVVRHMLLEHI